MAFPVPVDARAAGDFELVKGVDGMIRQDLPISTLTVDYDIGEWVIITLAAGVAQAAKVTAGMTLADPAIGAKVCWTKYRQNDSNLGQADVMATGAITVLSGSYQAKTKIYNTGGTFAGGTLLVVEHDAVADRGQLNAASPTGVTLQQLQRVVGRVIAEDGTVLHYEAPGL